VGAKTWMLVYATGKVEEALKRAPQPDPDATLLLATKLFPKDKLELIGDGDLCYTCPPDDELHIACFPGVSILAQEFGIDYPSKLPQSFISEGSDRAIYLHAMHSVVDWLAFAHWMNGKLVRSLSLSPESGILEDIGQRFAFEEPCWSGKHPATDDDEEDGYPLPFHPLEMGEVALKEFFGYQLEGFGELAPIEPYSIPLLKYKRSRSRWKLW
jgi:hypothetical protein